MLRRALAGALDPDDIIAALKDSELRGMGGAGFPTGTKWELVRNQDKRPKYAIVNADESEPAAFKDRQIMAEQPHLVLEGLLLGMLVTGAEEGWIFIRHEYEPEEHVLREELERLRGLGLLDEGGVTVDIFTSPGGYILGEESALIECMEGHRGEPRNKPPFPVEIGLFGKPTVVNNVETLANIPAIVLGGGEAFARIGTDGSTGPKLFCLSGHVARPGTYEVEFGATLRDLIDTGDELLAVEGMLSGTLAWLCNRFDGSVPFSALVREAHALGYTGAFTILDITMVAVAAIGVAAAGRARPPSRAELIPSTSASPGRSGI